jgi:hypothetical protein
MLTPLLRQPWPGWARACQYLWILCGLTLLLLGCNSGGQNGEISPQAVRNTRLEQQAVENLLALYRTALQQEDIDRLQDLLQPAPVPSQDGWQERGAFLSTIAATFRSSVVLDLLLTGVDMHLDSEPFSVAFQETLSEEDFISLVQRTQVFRTTWQLARDESNGKVTIRIAAVRREGPGVQVATLGQVLAGVPARIEVTTIFALAGVEVEVSETGQKQALVGNGPRWRGVFTPPVQSAPQPLRLHLQKQNGEVIEATHAYRLRRLEDGAVQRVPGTGSTSIFAVVVAADGTVWGGGDGGGSLYQVAPGANIARLIGQLSPFDRTRVEDLVLDQLGRLHIIFFGREQNGDIIMDQGIFCQTVNIFDPAYPFQVPDLLPGVVTVSPSTRAIAAGEGDIWLFGSDGGVARVVDNFRNGQCPDNGVEVRYAPVFRREVGGLISNTVPTLAVGADDTLWFGTAFGLSRWQHGRFTTLLFEVPLSVRRDVTTLEMLLQEVGQAIFFARPPSLLASGEVALLEPFLQLLFEAVFARHPLSSIALGDRSLTDFFHGPLNKEDIIFSAIKDAKGQLWVGTLGGGLRRIAAHGDSLQDTLHLTQAEVTRIHPATGARTVAASMGVISNTVLALASSSDGVIWAATDKGVSRIQEDQEEGNLLIMTHFSELDGLPLPVRDVKVDAQGIAWLATDGGLFRILPHGGSVQGSVRDTAGRPVGDADILVQGMPFRTVTDAEGHFLLAHLPPGSHRLLVDVTLATGASFRSVGPNVVVTTEALMLEPIIVSSMDGQPRSPTEGQVR